MQENVQTVLLEMASLLRAYYDTDWGKAYEKLANYIVLSPEETARRILASYGGMGSLNDVVLTSAGRPLIEENNRFDLLRSQLKRLCLNSLSGPSSS